MLLLLGFLAGQEQEQEPIQEDPGAFRIGVDVNQVFLSVTARSKQGGFVRGLTKNDFRVLEDDVEQEIINVIQEAVPVKVVLLIDTSGSTRYSQSAIRRAALRFAESLESEDKVAIITFNDAPRLILNWSNDLEKVKLALESIYAKGPTVMNDALFVTFDDLLRNVEGRKAVILLTDGIDYGTSVSFDEALDLAVRSEAMVYVASKLDEYWAAAIAARAQRGLLAPKELSDAYIIGVKRSLQRMSDMTGGRVLDAKAFSSLTDVYEAVAEELRNQYYISYVPSNLMRDGKYRRIEIRSRRAGVVTRTRPGYYAPADFTSNF
jgi:Ca-activated chloride channel family protein